ncbi:MAG: phosphoglucomutase [Sphaerochaeta sp.]|jgi:phosphomannomutase|nr:phosphoglucomutase [Sphaerochaeta sp.]MCH3920193.1 phosphoglucomutase [Sphaerochaeta sp.]MCI2045394.1 phosphoglucomutase [Sphaerochaeta sp.]MCI2076767.1 phosphoglucomutase [Sphaerochaeta sp.]MCI2096795.1 phosphoglucomutase [Sphaerochaeta sp.]
MLVYDDRTGHPIADNEIDPFSGKLPTEEAVSTALSQMILSASGWRKVFAQSGDGEDDTPLISHADAVLAAYAALILADHLLATKPQPTVLVGVDARPTGPAIADIAIRMFLAKGVAVRYLFIAAAPEIMAYNLRGANGGDAFFYISASHNPIGHNGIKFGADGGVYPGSITGVFADRMRTMASDGKNIARVQRLSATIKPTTMLAILRNVDHIKHEALSVYKAFLLETGNTTVEKLSSAIKARPLGILADFNGSARADSIDVTFLREIGLSLSTMNDHPGKIAHGIVPEGKNLETCRKGLESKHKQDPTFVLGYVPDNDGDRGNIVCQDSVRRKVVVPDAQEVFALVTMITLSEMRQDHPDAKLAIAVNGPTSLRIDRIADGFDCEVHRSEVGEANVVQLADQLREQGYLVKILGEGSNGGNITFPARVRDPMNTIITLLKLLGDPRILRLWCRLNKLDEPRVVSIGAALRALPVFTTTGAFAPDGLMHVHADPRALKNAYEKRFLKEVEEKKQELRDRWGLYGWTVYQMEGTRCVQGLGEEYRHAPYKGGWKAVFTDKYGVECAFIWMRPSGTEPVFRVLADSEGDDKSRHDWLLAWHRGMVEAADKESS